MDKQSVTQSASSQNNVKNIYSALGGRENEFIDSFYQLFLTRYPQYAHFFEQSEFSHKQRMIQTLDLLLSIHDQFDITSQNMRSIIGHGHRDFNLTDQDLQNFKQVFIEHLESFLTMCWSDEEKQQMNAMFDTIIVPAMLDGMK